MENQEKKFKELLEELETIITKFERNEIDLEEGIEKYKIATSIIEKLKERLEKTKSEVIELTK